ncbi:MAG: hypothetical protein HYS12_18760 [Planctomycetes bacterium]|nr:hypothetical protein [Planctomycetota bacterium]
MKLLALDIPDNPAELPSWLERELVGFRLGELVAELSAVSGGTGQRPSLREVLGGRLQATLDRGLGELPAETLKHLLLWPHLLLDLQERVFNEGGSYWERLGPASGPPAEAVERGRNRLETFLGAEKWLREPLPRVLALRRAARYFGPALVGLATAAAVLFMVSLSQHHGERPPTHVPSLDTAWGWNKPDAFSANAAAGPYLKTLADEAKEWFNKRPEDSIALARRLTEFRQGCAMLILSDHQPLSPADRQWLVNRCRLWARNVDRHLNALEAGVDWRQVRTDADETVEKLIEALRQRALAVEGKAVRAELAPLA